MQMRINLRGTGGQMTSAHDMAAVVSSKLRALSSKDVYAVAYGIQVCRTDVWGEGKGLSFQQLYV